MPTFDDTIELARILDGIERHFVLFNVERIDRAEAISLIAQLEPSRLSLEQRQEVLEIALQEPLEEYLAWEKLPQDLRTEFEGEDLLYSPDDDRYDPVISVLKADELQPFRNEYLEELLREANHPVKIKSGYPVLLYSCPCCGYRTLTEQAEWDICKICWWEDDGQDSKNADETFGGPNGGLSLTMARINFLKHGIFDPERLDLIKIQNKPEMYLQGRIFKLQNNEQSIAEEIPES